MRVALLVCDHVHPTLQKKYGDYVDMFRKLLPWVELEPFFVVDNHFPELDLYDAFVVTGSKLSVYDSVPWIGRLKSFTQQCYVANKHYVGICFGHQMIGEALGGKVQRARQGYLIGVHPFEIMNTPNWMHPKVSGYRILMLCQDQVVTLPPQAVVLAKSKSCPVGMFTVGERFLGIQGHPEFSKEYDREVFESRVDRIGSAKVEMAVTSFEENPDRSWLAGVIRSFLDS